MGKWSFIASILQLCVGIAGGISYIVLAVNGEPLGKWIPALLLSVAFVALGAVGIRSNIKK